MELSGVSVWRQVAGQLARDIEIGQFKANERLPRAEDLAARFSVNRHTITKAVAHLEAEGLVRMERGRGTYALVNPIEFRMGARNWFEQNLREGNRTPSRTLLSVQHTNAEGEIAAALEVKVGAPILFVTILGEADGMPINFTANHFPLDRLADLDAYLEGIGYEPTESFSFSAMFRSVGISDFRRKWMRIRARLPNREETMRLKMSPNAQVLTTQVLHVDDKGHPIGWAETAYPAARASLLMEYD